MEDSLFRGLQDSENKFAKEIWGSREASEMDDVGPDTQCVREWNSHASRLVLVNDGDNFLCRILMLETKSPLP